MKVLHDGGSEMRKTKKIMIVGAGNTQLDAIRKAKEMGLIVVTLDQDNQAIGFKEADHAEVINTSDIPRIIEAALKHHVDAIMTIGSEIAIRSAAIAAESIGLPMYLKGDLINKLTDKIALKNMLRDAGIPSPDFKEVFDYQDVKEVIERIRFPAVVKPSDRHGQRGVFNVLDSKSLSEVVEKSKSFSKRGSVLIEQFMEGPEISVHSFSSNGSAKIVAITDRISYDLSPYIGIIHRHGFPSSLSKEKEEEVKRLVEKTLNALEIENGPTYFQLIYSPEGPKIIEVAARLDGCHMWKLIKKVIGVDLLQETINLSLGKGVNLLNMPTEDNSNKAGILEFLDAKPYSRIGEITGLEEAKAVNGIDEINLYFKKGEIIKSLHGILEQSGYIIAIGENKESALKSIEKAKEILKLDFKEI